MVRTRPAVIEGADRLPTPYAVRLIAFLRRPYILSCKKLMTDVAAKIARAPSAPPAPEALPSLFREGWGAYEPDRRAFFLSFLLNLLAIAVAENHPEDGS